MQREINIVAREHQSREHIPIIDWANATLEEIRSRGNYLLNIESDFRTFHEIIEMRRLTIWIDLW